MSIVNLVLSGGCTLLAFKSLSDKKAKESGKLPLLACAILLTGASKVAAENANTLTDKQVSQLAVKTREGCMQSLQAGNPSIPPLEHQKHFSHVAINPYGGVCNVYMTSEGETFLRTYLNKPKGNNSLENIAEVQVGDEQHPQMLAFFHPPEFLNPQVR